MLSTWRLYKLSRRKRSGREKRPSYRSRKRLPEEKTSGSGRTRRSHELEQRKSRAKHRRSSEGSKKTIRLDAQRCLVAPLTKEETVRKRGDLAVRSPLPVPPVLPSPSPPLWVEAQRRTGTRVRREPCDGSAVYGTGTARKQNAAAQKKDESSVSCETLGCDRCVAGLRCKASLFLSVALSPGNLKHRRLASSAKAFPLPLLVQNSLTLCFRPPPPTRFSLFFSFLQKWDDGEDGEYYNGCPLCSEEGVHFCTDCDGTG